MSQCRTRDTNHRLHRIRANPPLRYYTLLISAQQPGRQPRNAARVNDRLSERLTDQYRK